MTNTPATIKARNLLPFTILNAESMCFAVGKFSEYQSGEAIMVSHNLTLQKRTASDGSIAYVARLFNTDIITIGCDDWPMAPSLVIFDTGGHYTQTTMLRLHTLTEPYVQAMRMTESELIMYDFNGVRHTTEGDVHDIVIPIEDQSYMQSAFVNDTEAMLTYRDRMTAAG